MNVNALKNQFISFLRLNGVIEEFFDNFQKAGVFQSISDLCSSVKREEYVLYAFDWAKSKHGKEFWRRISLMWANSDPNRFCDKPDKYMTPFALGEVVKHEVHGDIVATESKDCACVGCVFSTRTLCTNDGTFGCTPYSRGDRYNVIYKKKCE